MTAPTDARLDKYLACVRAALRGLPDREIEDILGELHSHAIDLAASDGMDAAVRAMGDPVDLARSYRTENAIAQAECAGSPLTILLGLRHTSSTRVGRVFVTAAYVFGYANVLTLWAAAIQKIFSPSRVGLWWAHGRMLPLALVTDGQPPSGAHELLGWWLVPAALVAGWLLREGIDAMAHWWIRRYRRSHARGLTAA